MSGHGETDLATMLRSLEPALTAGRFSFSTHRNMSFEQAAALSPVCVLREAEGLTVIAEGGDGPWFSMISLSVHSSLDAVGLTAALSTALGNAGISANIVAGYYHDHIFVPEADTESAMAVLRGLANA